MAAGSFEKTTLLLLGIVFILGICRSEPAPYYGFMRDASQSPRITFYDYIIVGGGTAGCPLAATLSQHFSVLLLERGGSPYGNDNITKLENFERSLNDDGPRSPSQQFISEDGVYNHRARVLGGGSCLNAGFYSRAAPEYVEAAGWDAALVNESYPWIEKMVAFEPVVKQWQSAVRDALIGAGVDPFNGFTYDHMYGTKVGGTIFDEQGNRHTAADLLRYANPQRLTVLLHASVRRIYFTSVGMRRSLAYGVMYTDSFGWRRYAYLRRRPGSEVIVSAGALGSPQLLMVSGVGPADHLAAMGIPLVLDLPAVGEGMADNPMNAIYVPSPTPVEASLIQVVGITRYDSYIEAASMDAVNRNYGLMAPEIGQLATVPPKKRTAEAIAAAVGIQKDMPDIAFEGGFLLEKIAGPLSKGRLRLRTTNVDDNPSVTFNYFENPEDLERCVSGMRIIENLVTSPQFSNFIYSSMTVNQLLNLTTTWPVNLLPKHGGDNSSLEDFCRDTVMTIWHYHGGCQVGRVVDDDYRVLGVDALRVIDGSTFNSSPGTNPQATVMMLGRYMGVQILRERDVFNSYNNTDTPV